MQYCKSAFEFAETRVQDDRSVIGSDFCDFLSPVPAFRLIGAYDMARILERVAYR